MKTFGAIFDWDGVIVDSEPQHKRSWERLSDETGLRLPRGYFKKSFGMKSTKIIPEILKWTRDPGRIDWLTQRKAELYRDIALEEGVPALPGVLPFFRKLERAGIPCVVASSTQRMNVDCLIGRIGVADFLRGIVTAENVRHGKPHPEIFLLAAKKIRTPPERCVVFEDAHVGIEAARAAGMKVVGVATTHSADSLEGADRIVRRLDELTVAQLRSMF